MFPQINPRQSFPALEEEMLAYWKANNTFKKSLEIREWAPEFNFYDGPPFATGTPHYGHLLAGTIKDVIPRYQTMQGKFVERRFGWDCHGLPIENIVEKKLGISGKKDIEEKVGVYEFNEECRRNVFGYVDDWRQMVERTGRWVDMDNDYKTMDTDFMESVWWVFKNIYDKGYVYESYRVVPYCTRCSTPLSNFEVNQGYEDKQDKAVTVKFKVKWTASKYILAWTTTPWTLPANLGLAVGTDLQYAEILDKATGDTYVLATDRIATYYKNPEDYTLVREYPGSCLIGMEYEPILPITEGIFEGNHTDCIGVWIILKNNEGQYFLQKRTDDAPLNPGKVALFGGGMNKWEDEKDAILREVEEELDMSLERSKLQLVKYHPSINYPGKSIAIFAYETAIELPRILKEGQEILTLSSEEIFASEEATRFTKEFIQYFEGIKTGSNVLGRKAFQVVPGHHVTTDSGTGVVHIAPAYGEDDFQIGKRENLGFISHIDAVGHTTGLLSDNDVYVFDYNQIVIDRLKSEKKLVHVGTIDHSYPHCYRCHTPLIYRAISAWYVNVESMKDRMIANNEKVNWVPETIKHGRFGKWVEGARDWNISRNRYWGSAIPVWKSEDGDVQVIGSVEELYEANREFGDITKIIFVRHGESLKNTEGIIDGTDKPKFPLTEKWKQQAEKVTELLKDENISAIYSSSFRRARETAEIINQKYWLDIVYDDRLREVFWWKMDGMKRTEMQEEYDIEHDKYLENWSYKIGGWESANDIKARMQDFVEEIGAKYAWKTVVVVSHADPIAVVNEHLTGKKSFWKGIAHPQTGTPSTIYYHVSERKTIDLHKHFVDNIKLSKDGKTYTRIPEVLDCWFESGSMPYASKHYPFDFLSPKTIDVNVIESLEEKVYAINICLLPDEETMKVCKKLNTLDTETHYNDNSFEYIPHATIVMKSVDKEDIIAIREKLEKLDFSWLESETDGYYFMQGGGGFWNGVSIKENENLRKLKKQILNITKEFSNKKRSNNSYAVSEFFETDELPILNEDVMGEKEGIYITFGKNDIREEFEKANFPKKVKFSKICIGQMGNYGSVRKSLFEIEAVGGNFRFPADFIAEGLDQTRGWFYTLLILGTALFDNTPFMNVIVNGLILAEDGKKMSKSLKNYPDPNEIINKHGADALRFFMLSSQVVKAEDLRFSEAGVEETVKKVLLPLWNTYSFFTTYANIDGWSPSGTVVDYVRHGQTSLNIAQSGAVQEERTVSWGLNDHELTDEGVAQCNRLGEELRKKGAIYDVIVTTGMKRTDNTARIIAEEIGFNGEWVTEEGLRERMVDEKHEGALWSDIAREYKEQFPDKPIQTMGMYLLAEMGVAESNDAFEARTFGAYKGIIEKYTGKRILIVGHGNTFRSVYGNVMGVEREEALTNKMYRLKNAELVHLPAVPLTNPLDRFIISELQVLIAKTINAFESYDLQQATRAIVDFMDDLTNWYIRRSRRRFWKSENDGDKMGAYETLYYVLTTLTQVMAPITPMITEAVYRGLTGRESVHLEYFPEFARTAVSQTLQADMKRAREIITLGLALRGQKKIRVRQPLASITIGESIDAYFQEIIREELNVKEVKTEDMSAVARKICKPNAKLIGPRFGKSVQDIIREAKAGNFEELDGGRIKIPLTLTTALTPDPSPKGRGEDKYILEPGEYEIVYEPLSGVSLDVMSGSGMVIAMDTVITDELETEGYARDIVRVIQDLRKEAGYEVSDRVQVALWGEKIDSVLSLFSDYIASETLSVIDNSLTEGDISREVDMEGVKVSVMVKR